MQIATPYSRGPTDGDTFDQIAQSLEQVGYAVLSGVLPASLTDSLFADLKALEQAEFKPAGVGRQDDFQVNRFVRLDKICWLRGESQASAEFLAWTEKLREGLNRRLFLGLFDYECHYASYPVGAFYKKHLDAFKGQSNRVLSTVFYLNPSWQPADGGELVLYPESGSEPLEVILPEYGKLVIFLSEEFPHEVLPAHRPRHSIAGWFRINTSSAVRVDPPSY
ncbi:2OG-Fe(II) oxygenase [Marinimicrobium sp. ABcell2]|uniref:2OG-Fe(II) oxygenase n=1 Tax=Marinimicrobium sp. ABcell2 TaxID=3069751 RepID=UPI0027AE09A1|nr:2OG-Fe(II) oxygenase [Marinimicrobium sp. ABcell2]MDQ2075192.1 2OG-Fe(II) oxygenase [Marinimicrobium sp. ABcell2]